MASGTVEREPLATYPPITAQRRLAMPGMTPVEDVESVTRTRTFLPAPDEPGVSPLMAPPLEAVCQVLPPLVEVCTRRVATPECSVPPAGTGVSQVMLLLAIAVIAPIEVDGPVQVPDLACMMPKLSN